MKAAVAFDREESRFEIRSEGEPSDILEKYAGERVYFDVPEAVEGTHPDLLALTVILTLHPFVGERLALNLAVSSEFALACEQRLPYRCEFAPTPQGVTISQRAPGTVPALSFSGGIDSAAALAVMPEYTHCVFLDRVHSDGVEVRSSYDKDSALAACRMVEERGITVSRISTNLEYVRKPVGFPVDWATGAPAVLLADLFDFSSISWGMVAESGYRMGHAQFAQFDRRTIFTRWDGLLRAVGLALGVPVGGVSEVGTSLIEMRSGFAGVGQSCIRGPKGQPCQNCAKCFRKSLLDAALTGRPFDSGLFERMARFRGGAGVILTAPMKHENVYRWAAERMELVGESDTWDAFKDRLSVGDLDVSWAGGWYPPSAALIPSEYRDHATEEIGRYLPEQSVDQQSVFEAWDMRPVLDSEPLKQATERLAAALQQPVAEQPA